MENLIMTGVTNPTLIFESDLNSINSGESSIVLFRPSLRENMDTPLMLESIHERKGHLIVVSEDLEYFTHVHPVAETNNTYSAELTLPYGGNYKLFAEYKPIGHDKITEIFDFTVHGAIKQAKIYKSKNNLFVGDDYTVVLLNTENLIAGSDAIISAEFYEEGKKISINKVENYLGEKAHAVAISVDDKNFSHVHPMIINDSLKLQLSIDKPGLNRLWLQFKINEQVYTADFVVEASQSVQHKNVSHKHIHN